MVIEDLQDLPRSPLVVAEGTSLPAGGVKDPSRAVWLQPTAPFQQARLDERRLSHGPRQLFLLLAETIEREAEEAGVRTLVVDGSRTVVATVEAVEQLSPMHSPKAMRRNQGRSSPPPARCERGGRRAGARLLRRPWAEGDPDAEVRSFLCERGDPACERSLDVPVSVAAAAPVLAADHS
jgi:hypothetical protein